MHHAFDASRGHHDTHPTKDGHHHNLRGGDPNLPYDGAVWDNIGEQTIKFFDHYLRC